MQRYLLGLLLFLVAILGNPHSAYAAWIPCGSERNQCIMANAGHNLVRYGKDSKYLLLETEGVSEVGCNNNIFGDPNIGADKTCEYTPAPAAKGDWRRCGNEGGNCGLPDDAPRLVRYGVPGRWIYRIASSNIPCNNGEFTDIAGGAKQCQYSVESYSVGNAGSSFQDCGTEYTTCHATQGVEVTLFRYGVSPNWAYRLGTMADVNCGNGTFSRDPAQGRAKFCQFMEFPPAITGVNGQWAAVASCANCAEGGFQRGVTVGITGARSKRDTKTWSHEVSVEIEKEFKGMLKVKGGYKFTTGGEESTENSLTRSSTTDVMASCPHGKSVTMWQWKMDVDEICFVTGGGCRSTIASFDIVCAIDQPPSYKPICPPGTFTDELALNCRPK